jgi:glycine cleavage system aminomethyltransferase T
MAAGARHGLVNAGYRAIDSLSIEKGEPKVDMALGSQSRHQKAEDTPVTGV